MAYRVWVREWTKREEEFPDRNSAGLFRLKLAASCPSLSPSDVVVVPDRAREPALTPPAAA